LINKLTKKDKKDWLKFVNRKDKLFDKEAKNNNIINNLEKKIDLHGYGLESANLMIEKYINKCFIERVDRITVITGKGNRSNNKNDPYKSEKLSILKYSVPEFIKSNLNLMKIIKRISSSEVEDNSKGSFEIYLKKFKE
tara:strand:+ start:805 stop:1221 length:417 start_codon:yes stop_codon:yes gene_type:complete